MALYILQRKLYKLCNNIICLKYSHSLKMATYSTRNMHGNFYIQELGQRIDDELVFMYQLHRRCTILS